MTDYRSWRAPFRAMCPEPGPHDLFLVILINGRRAAIQHADDYDKWRSAAEELAAQENCNVKVLPMSGSELMNFLGIEPAPPHPIANLDPAFRDQAVKNCMDVLRECAGASDRGDALDLLGHLGVLQ
ncbi:hypothetical protein SKP52_10890 [Sphingopyxis fribergensis]|uniref:Uncharacterized protein n=1 Tax=Sphingopyxis fribergensis TaxID=1515612 RepID=A0A0A7PGH4_9SPHN|nr:hypothetical protein [Sphingopyxis fribergensis]AJA09079.1 hypothetical protein SKP52_10890 [Sphingopyxis fribergensis]